MSSQSNGVHEFPVDATRIAPQSEPRPMYWSIRREVWENRSIYLAPLAVAAFVLFGCFLATLHAASTKGGPAAAAMKLPSTLQPISMAPAPVMLATFLVGFFYCLDALYGERRDRSILFWKSLPVSDATAVLSKASIPLVVLPLIGFLLGLALQIILLPVALAASAVRGIPIGRLWAAFPEPLVMIYGLGIHALWFAPIYCWLLLVSGWARRAPALWAVLPLLVVAAVERIAFNTSYFIKMLGYRMTGAMHEGFVTRSGDVEFTWAKALNFAGTPGLWAGLIFAAGCLALAVRLRRNREPI